MAVPSRAAMQKLAGRTALLTKRSRQLPRKLQESVEADNQSWGRGLLGLADRGRQHARQLLAVKPVAIHALFLVRLAATNHVMRCVTSHVPCGDQNSHRSGPGT